MYKQILVPIDLADTDLAKPAIEAAVTLARSSGGHVRLVNVLPMTPVMLAEYVPPDFDAQQRTITNLKAFANPEGKPIWYAYARWIDGESAVIYHSTQTGKAQLYVYRLEDGSTKCVSTNPKADYRYPHGEAAPC